MKLKKDNNKDSTDTSAIIGSGENRTKRSYVNVKNKKVVLFATACLVVVIAIGTTLYLNNKDSDLKDGELTAEQQKEVKESKQANLLSDITVNDPAKKGATPQETAANVKAQLPPVSAETVVGYIDLADYQYSNGLYTDAITSFQAALPSAAPGDQKVVVYLGIAESNKNLGNTDEARKNYELAYAEVKDKDETYDAIRRDIQGRINAL